MAITAVMSDFREHVRRAVDLVGGQSELARRIGMSQPTVFNLCTNAKAIRAEVAKLIDEATEGRVSKSDLRPDIWGQA